VRDFKSLAKEADESLAKHKALELEIERLLRTVISQDIMSITELDPVVRAATSGEIPGVDEFELTLATTALFRGLQTLDLLSIILKHSRVVPADSSSSVPADYVSAGHVLVSSDRDRIC
ncbi:hypothetical protein Tco_0182993, partial [Tanacetum coccineum]